MIDCDPNIMKSYRVNYGNFDPRFQVFQFDSKERSMRIKGEGYDFTLSNITLA